MQTDIFIFIFSSLTGVIAMMFGAIWAKLNKIEEKVTDICIKEAGRDIKLQMIESTIEKLQCVN